MRRVLALVSLALAAFPALAAGAALRSEGYYREKFVQWMHQHGYDFPRHEFARRLAVWSDNDDFISRHNAQGNRTTYRLGHNAYSHLTADEFGEMMGLRGRGVGHPLTRTGQPQPLGGAVSFDGDNDEMAESVRAQQVGELAKAVDWVEAGAVTPVKNQGQCGSCWSFSTTGNLEGAYFIKHGELVSFSEQELVSCDGGDNGCNGGLMDFAFEYIKENGGLCTEEDYPYTASAGFCKKRRCEHVAGSRVVKWVDVHPGSDQAMLKALNVGPVSVAIEADQREFQLYAEGVFTGPCGTNLDHGVLAVGYGTSADGIDFYKIKNSWGDSWGQSGYIYLQRGVKQAGGQCGVLMAGSYISELE